MDVKKTLTSLETDKESNRELTELQKSICQLVIEDSNLSAPEIAESLGCDKSAVYKTLRKQHVREYLLAHVSAQLLLAGSKAMETQANLLDSKSDYIRHQAATDILNRNEIGGGTTVIGQAVNVKIDLS